MARKNTRKFGGKTFKYLGAFYYKDTAERRAKTERAKGYNVRIVKGSGRNPRFTTVNKATTYRMYVKKRK